MSEAASSLQHNAKKMLVQLSEYSFRGFYENWRQFSPKSSDNKQLRKKQKIIGRKNIFSQRSNTRPLFHIRKVSVQDHGLNIGKKVVKQNKQNAKPMKIKTPKRYLISKKKNQKLQKTQIDYLDYWIKHRAQQDSILTLVQRIKLTRSTTPITRL